PLSTAGSCKGFVDLVDNCLVFSSVFFAVDFGIFELRVGVVVGLERLLGPVKSSLQRVQFRHELVEVLDLFELVVVLLVKQANALILNGEQRGFEIHSGKVQSAGRSEEHTSELQSRFDLVCRLLLEK